MSVVKSKRKEGQLTIFTKASNLAEHTIKICSNEKYFPKKIITQKSKKSTFYMFQKGRFLDLLFIFYPSPSP